uniref:Uncharacterized protein n=1 Tax=Bionectria ochroleuca TaxID=29856 RepID=A0A0B7KDP6_BIOOC
MIWPNRIARRCSLSPNELAPHRGAGA